MFALSDQHSESSRDELVRQGYWPARAARFLADGKYSRAVEICREYLSDTPHMVSGRLVYAEVLYRAGQVERATEQFYRVLSLDPDHLVALKYLGDIKYADGDELTAQANYQRILEIDPGCCGLRSEMQKRKTETTRTVTIHRRTETAAAMPTEMLREIPFYTETVGDLYLSQGHHRLAASVFQNLVDKDDNPRLREKLDNAEKKIITKEP
ncbi:MAG: tetratricopeptide repeat protein [candidate division Zixibacteria bacterium]|nr:tetratricopeptide repeat protein [candidate division Zixibacteria bacterium]